MQFSELSELNSAIRMMRELHCNSPTFHDRQDSEIDRIYNSSPPATTNLNLPLLPVTKPTATSSKPSLSTKPNGQQTTNNTEIDSNQNSSKKTTHSDQPPSQHPHSNIESSDSGQVTIMEDNGVPSEDNVADSLDKKNDDQNMDVLFTREELPVIKNDETSLLETILKGKSTSEGPPRIVSHGADAAVLHLTIYLPTREEMKIDLYEVSTVEESIETILRTHRAEGRTPALYYGHPVCYELRLHDADGLPDEDFPALDRSRKIKNFGDAGGHEYCLCERPDACPPSDDTPSTEIQRSNSISTTQKKRSMTTIENKEKGFLKIFMPNEDYTVVAIDETTTGKDLLPALNKKHRLQLFQDEYVLKMSEADKERLSLPSIEIDLNTKLRPLCVSELTLTTKTYADAPQVIATCGNEVSGDEVKLIDDRTRPPPETFMFNDITAAMYKEWEVIKVNKYGKRQSRMLGIDLHKIYNRKVGERAIKSRTSTKHAERPISTVAVVQFLSDPSDFRIYFMESEELAIDYSAGSPYECAEIVAKLKYIMSRRNK